MSDNKTQNKNPHKNHRARLRETFKKAGLDGMQDHNVLEFILFYSIPRKDTNEIAHRLIDTFGSLSRVFDATYEQLLGVEGVGESSALLISQIPALCRRYAEGKNAKKINLSDADAAKEYIIKKYFGCRVEIFYVLCLDALGNLINCCKLGEGSSDTVVIDKRAVLEVAFRNNADKVIIAHNHPDGIAAPSREDLGLTSSLSSVLSGVGIRLADHIIVAGNDAISLASIDKFKPLFI